MAQIQQPLSDLKTFQEASSDIKKYNVDNHRYPLELGTNDDMPHFVAFYINVREKSELFGSRYQNNLNKTVTVSKVTDKLTPKQIGETIPVLSGIQGAVIGAGLTSISGLTTAAGKGGKGSVSTAIKIGSTLPGAAAGFALGYGAAKLAMENLNILKQTSFQRLKDVITLHVEDRPVVKYGINYAEKDLGILTGLISQFASQINSWEDLLSDRTAKMAGEALAVLSTTLTKIPGALGGARISDLLGATAGVAINPFREALFESIDYRSFNFRYRFFPKSEQETNAVKNIIDTFKEHMHPELSSSKFFFIYPSEFEIVYYFKNPDTKQTKENPYFHRIATCALTDMTVEYGGDTFSTFKNGAPTQINLTLTFRELEQLTKKEMLKGY